MSAITAYNAGATGAGVTVAVVDSGINPDLPEFAGRISPASFDVAGDGSRGISDEDGHGTSIAGVIAAAKDDVGIQGVAFGATILSLRTDEPGTCAEEDGCSHSDNDIARAVDIATTNNAKVINISLGGSPASLSLRNAIARATRAGIIIVISAGNESDPNPDPLAQLATNTAISNGLIIIAGANDSTGTIADFSDRAGNSAAYYLSALGVRVRSFDQTNGAFLFSGTSYSAPNVTGAVALLRQAFPTMTAAQIVNLLYTTATDAGDPGVDAVYGHGILNLTNAFRPQGAASLAGSAVPVSTTDNAALGAAFGDGGQAGESLKGAVILDGYGRAFAMDLARTIAATPESRVLASLADRSLSGGGEAGPARFSVTVTPATSTRPWVGISQQGLDNHAADKDRPVRGLVSSAMGASGIVGAAFGYAPETLAAAVGGGWGQGNFLAAGHGGDDAGLSMRGGSALAYARHAGPWMLSFAAGHAAVDDPRPGRGDAGQADTMTLRAERRLGPVSLAAGIAELRESDTLLGSRGPALGIAGATSRFASLEARAALGGGWSLVGNARTGWTQAHLTAGAIESAGTIRSSGFSATLSKAGVFGGDRFDLRVAQPLRVDRAAARFSLPVSYDYATLSTGFEDRTVNLAPSGREIDAEAVYAASVLGGDLGAHLFWRREPGHVLTRDPDVGAALTFAVGF